MHDGSQTPPLPSSTPKKGLPTLAWLGIGCGGLLVIAAVAVSMLVGMCTRKVGEFTRNPEKTAAEMMVRMRPDIEKVSENDKTGEMTIRTKDGKEMTLNYRDLSEGKFGMTDSEGNMAEMGVADFSKIPSWVPRVPGMQNASGSYQNRSGDRITGLYATTTAVSPEELEKGFAEEAAALGLNATTSSSMNAEGVTVRSLSYKGDTRQLTFVITGRPGAETQVNVGYEEERK